MYLNYLFRSVLDPEDMLYNDMLNNLATSSEISQLPTSLLDFSDTFNASPVSAPNNSDGMIDGVIKLLLIIRLMVSGHPKSKPYYEEVCGLVHPNQMLHECERQLYAALNQYDGGDFGKVDGSDVFADDLAGLIFEANNVMHDTEIGRGLILSVCLSQGILMLSNVMLVPKLYSFESTSFRYVIILQVA